MLYFVVASDRHPPLGFRAKEKRQTHDLTSQADAHLIPINFCKRKCTSESVCFRVPHSFVHYKYNTVKNRKKYYKGTSFVLFWYYFALVPLNISQFDNTFCGQFSYFTKCLPCLLRNLKRVFNIPVIRINNREISTGYKKDFFISLLNT